MLLAKVEELNAQAEAASDEGDVEKAMALMEQTKALNKQAEEVAAEIKKNAKREGAQKKLRLGVPQLTPMKSSSSGQKRTKDTQ